MSGRCRVQAVAVVVVVALVAGLAAVAAPVAGASESGSVTFGHIDPQTGEPVQSWVVPPGVGCLWVEAVGASGATGGDGGSRIGVGGLGGTASATVDVIPGETLEIRIGGTGTFSTGGFNGGGNGRSGAGSYSGGGGGGTDLRQGGSDLDARVVVGGGGGGGGAAKRSGGNDIGFDGGGGGGLTGVDTGEPVSWANAASGTQTSGGIAQQWANEPFHPTSGSEGVGGTGAGATDLMFSNAGGGGGGGGWYGGAGGNATVVSSGASGTGGGGGSGHGPPGTVFGVAPDRGNGSLTISYDPAVGSCSGGTLAADHRFSNSLGSSVGTLGPVVPVGEGANAFATEPVDGATRPVLQFPAGNGVDLGGLSSELAHRAYTVVVLFRFDEVGGFRRIVNFAGDDRDTGLYLNDGTLTWFPGASGPTAVAPDQWVQVVLTRSAAGELRGYVDGEEQFIVSDAAGDGIISDADTLRFFRDDGNREESSGAVARIRLFNGPLSPSQVQALDRLLPDVTDPTVDLRTPPAGAVYARNQAVAADFSCADDADGSGIASCVGTVADGSAINTATLGTRNFTVTATDVAGNATQVIHTYTVADPRPDGRIKKAATGSDVGDTVYNTTGAGQTRSGSAARGSSVIYYVSAQNDAPFADALRLRGPASNTRFSVKYTVGGVNVTPQITAGTYLTPTLAPGATHTVKVVVTVRSTASVGSSLTGSFVSRSNTNPAIRDTVKFVTRRS